MRQPSHRREQYILILICIAACAHLAQTQLYLIPYLDLSAFADLRADAPYQYRVLTAFLLRAFDQLLAPKLASTVAGLHEPFNTPNTIFEFVLAFCSILISSWFTYQTARKLALSAHYAWLAVFALLYMCYFNLSVIRAQQFYLPYDLTALAFFCSCLYLALRNRLLAFTIVFFFATLNRETAILYLIPLAAMWLQSKPIRATRVFYTLLFCSLSWLAFKIGIPHYLPTVSGSSFFFQISYNLHALVMPQRLLLMLSVMGFLWIPLALYSWRVGPFWLRTAAIIYPISFLSMFLVGIVIEIRIFVELAAIAALHIAFIVRDRLTRAPALEA